MCGEFVDAGKRPGGGRGGSVPYGIDVRWVKGVYVARKGRGVWRG